MRLPIRRLDEIQNVTVQIANAELPRSIEHVFGVLFELYPTMIARLTSNFLGLPTEARGGSCERRLAGSTGLEPDSECFSKLVMARDFWM